MRRLSLGLLALVLLGVSACGNESDAPETPEGAAESAAAEVPAPEAAAAPEDAAVETSAVEAEAAPAASGAPAFAVIYPGGVLQGGEADSAGQAGSGGLATYLVSASPDEVIAFHRARAEAEGLASVMAMNQGEARAYGAHSTRTGANLSVFATPDEDGVAVQLVWSGGG